MIIRSLTALSLLATPIMALAQNSQGSVQKPDAGTATSDQMAKPAPTPPQARDGGSPIPNSTNKRTGTTPETTK